MKVTPETGLEQGLLSGCEVGDSSSSPLASEQMSMTSDIGMLHERGGEDRHIGEDDLQTDGDGDEQRGTYGTIPLLKSTERERVEMYARLESSGSVQWGTQKAPCRVCLK